MDVCLCVYRLETYLGTSETTVVILLLNHRYWHLLVRRRSAVSDELDRLAQTEFVSDSLGQWACNLPVS